MALSSSNAAKQLADGSSQGTMFGRSTDSISFYGATPTTKDSPGVASLSTAVSSTGAFGFGDAGTASSVIAVINRLRTMGLV